MSESDFQAFLKKELKDRFPGCIILKNDPNYIQGFPDLIILWKKFWACLEVKKDRFSNRQPNQQYWVTKCDGMSFAAFIYPENKDDVLDALSEFFGIY